MKYYKKSMKVGEWRIERGQGYRDLKHSETYDPASLWGRLIFLSGLVVMFILWVTGIVPYALQPAVSALLVTIMITGAVLSFVGYFRYYGRYAFIFLIVMISIVLVMMWYSTP